MKNTISKPFRFLLGLILLSIISSSVSFGQTILTGSVSTKHVCRGGSISVSYSANGMFGTNNSFNVQLSAPNGTFTTFTVIGSQLVSNVSNTTFSGVITATIPATASVSGAYRVRIVATSPQVIGSVNADQIYVLGAPANPTFNMASSICSGQSFVLPNTSSNNIGGTWSPALNNTSTTTYTFTPNSNFCANTAVRTISVTPTQEPIFNQAESVCAGNTILALPTQSLNNITGTWSPALNNTQTTTYTFTATTGSCILPKTMTITVNPRVQPVFEMATYSQSYCSGDSIVPFPQTSLNGISGTWWPAINNQNTTNYTFTPSQGVCAAQVNQSIVVNQSAIIDTIVAAYQTYTWPVNGETYTSSGIYTYVEGCTVKKLKLTIVTSCVVATPGLISGLSTGLCVGGVSTTTFSILPVTNATSYVWTAPAGTTIVSGQGTTSIVLNIEEGFTSGNLAVKSVNPCAESTERIKLIGSILARPASISGSVAGLCAVGNSNPTYIATTVANAENYTWISPEGTAITTGQGTQTISLNIADSFVSGNLVVTANNVCGSSLPTSIAISSLAAQPGVITGVSTGLGVNGTQTTTYSIASVNGAIEYLWTVPTGATIVSGQGTVSITVEFNSSFTSGNLSVESLNACGNSLKRTLILYSVPRIPLSISGAFTSICSQVSSELTYSIAPVLGATSYTWTVPVGTIILSGQGTNSITLSITSSFASGNLSVTANNICGSSAPRILMLNSTPRVPGIISGISSGLCSIGTSISSYKIVPVLGAVNYTWTVPTGATIVSGQGTDSISVEFSGVFTSGSLSVVANNACGSSAPRVLALNSVPRLPGLITGRTNDLCPDTNGVLTYTIAPVAGATSYLWTVPAGTTLLSGQGTTSISLSVSADFISGPLRIAATNGCGVGAERSVWLRSIPLTPAITSGSVTPCGTETYTCSSVTGAVGYTWTVPAGLVIISGQGTNTITVNVTNATVSGNIQVRAFNNCKTGAPGSLRVRSCLPSVSRTMSTEITEESISNSELITKIEAVVYPNPTNGEVNIEFTNELEKNVSIELYDMIGNKVSKSDIPAGSTVGNLTLEGMTSGMYLLQVVNSNNDIIYKTKVSKQ
ncbi:MAG: T9SS C-terminal target domain-containing protein [Flavobacteriales bacterium]|nr:T9SS C-terminal target domain-containing protein [Flavobacteriales bacterium]